MHHIAYAMKLLPKHIICDPAMRTFLSACVDFLDAFWTLHFNCILTSFYPLGKHYLTTLRKLSVDNLAIPIHSEYMSQQLPNYAIARIDLPDQRTYGWQVRLQRRGIKYAKFFSDTNCGGNPENSFLHARKWRDQLLSQLENLDQTRICQRSNRNSSGVVGVSKVSVVSSNGVTYHFWQATWSPESGKRKCLKFSIKRYGDSQAFELAVQARIDAINSDSIS